MKYKNYTYEKQQYNPSDTEDSSGLILDTNVINDKKSTYTSLLDLYGVQIFTEDSIGIDENCSNEDKAYNNTLLNNIFHNNNLVEEDINYKLFYQMDSYAVKDETIMEKQNYNYYYYIIGACIFICFLLYIVTYNIKRKKRRINSEYNIDL